jgi:hypothetical protein
MAKAKLSVERVKWATVKVNKVTRAIEHHKATLAKRR